jgi:transcriptional regulator with XRE-family HTH domain
VRKYRKEKGLSQMDLAYACNDTDYSQINRIELGKVNFSVSFLTMLATKLDVDVKDLLG